MPHVARPAHLPRYPVHVTLKIRPGAPNLRQRRSIRRIEQAFREGCCRFGMRLTHYVVQKNHLHLIVEADDAKALSRGMQGLTIRLAKGLNALWGTSGKVFLERYHARPLRTPTEVQRALRYVLCNTRRHTPRQQRSRAWLDPCSSACYFDGWRGLAPLPLVIDAQGVGPPVVAPHSWLLTKGWRRLGLLSPDATPGARAA